jgi:DNA mismatch repair protein MutS
MMEQYLKIKQNHRDTILFFRLGDFYEMFFDDALLASKELEITLTGREAGEKGKVPMCGVPYHAAENYITRLIKKGYKVAICEQVEDPAAAKGIVRREVVRIVTPGTVLGSHTLEEKNNNYIVSLAPAGNTIGLAVADISTGLFQATQFSGDTAFAMLMDELSRLEPAEILIADNQLQTALALEITQKINTTVTAAEPSLFAPEAAGRRLKNILRSGRPPDFYDCMPQTVPAAGALLAYIEATQKKEIAVFKDLQIYSGGDFMLLDAVTRKNLELTVSIKDGGRWGTLLWVLDNTRTAMGGRLLKDWLERPLLRVGDIEKRLASVEEMTQNLFARHELSSCMEDIYDLERLTSRALFGSANARDLLALKKSLAVLPRIKSVLEGAVSNLFCEYCRDTDTMEDIHRELDSALLEDPPVSVREGALIKDGYHPEIDRLRSASREGRNWLAGLEAAERERTGIKSLKIGFNKVFGYYIEITRSNLGLVPDDYIRRQTLANAERYITPRLKEMEDSILGAEDKLTQLEYTIFNGLRESVAASSGRILGTASALAGIDCIISLAETAIKENYIRPRIGNHGRISIIEGRHPVVEKVLGPGEFVPNDIELGGEQKLVLLTGPNMAGKSTYMRQVALLVLMAQTGSYVPARDADIGVVNRIFTRVGAADDLAGGQSTFMVEMKECQVIACSASRNSLIIMDEVGRGTSTYDGISIARALVEYIVDKIGAKTIFSTHYHELTDLELLPGVKNFTVLVREEKDNIYFLRRVIPGCADKSYGIHVAALAGLPGEIITRAKYNLAELEGGCDFHNFTSKSNHEEIKPLTAGFLTGGAEEAILKELFDLDILRITPLEAMSILADWQKRQQSVRKRNTLSGS